MNFQDCCFSVAEGTLKACWVLTNSCNLHCYYCASEAEYTTAGILSVGKSVCRRAVEACYKAGIDKIVLSGGEPLIVRNLTEIVGHLNRNGFGVSVSTNATLLSAKLLGDLRMAGLAKLVIGVDASRVVGAPTEPDTKYAAQIARILQIIQKSNTPYELNIVLLPSIELAIDELADWLRDFQPVSVNLIEPQACGRLAMSNANISLDWDQCRIEQIATNLTALIEPLTAVIVSPRCQESDCPSERLIFGITPDGSLDKCPWKRHLNVVSPKQYAPSLNRAAISSV